MTDVPGETNHVDDELDGCAEDFTTDPSRNYDAERLLEERSKDRTEHEEEIRRAV